MNQNENFGGEGLDISPACTEEMKKNKGTKKVSLPLTIVLILFTALLTFQTTFVVLSIRHKLELTKTKAAIGKFDILLEVYDIFDKEYVYDINTDALIDQMIASFDSQDRYSAYYTFEEYLAMLQSSHGSAKGIGAYVSGTITTMVVTYVIPGSPAEAAGLIAGDEILAINGKYVKDIGYNGASDMIAGENGTQAMLKILRGNEELEIAVTRSEYTPYTVTHSVIEENGEKLGFIKIIQFDAITVQQFQTAVEELKAEGCKKFIFDLRNNIGGELSSVVSILDYILPEGPIVHILDANKDVIDTYKSNKNELVGEMVVLANGKTASAAELFTSALRDYDKATIIGTKTYGKGCGQSIHPLSNGGYITITSFFYNPPYGENYDGVGIYPDIEVELPEEYKNTNMLIIPRESDTQLHSAIAELTK